MSRPSHADSSWSATDLDPSVVEGTGYADAVHQLLAVVRTQLGMQVAWVSEFVGSRQVLRFVDAEPGVDAPAEGSSLSLSGSFCARVLDGRFPSSIPDSRAVPEAALLDVTSSLRIGSYVGVPLLGPEGAAIGMLCAISDGTSPHLGERDVEALRMLASLLCDLQERALSEESVARARVALLDSLHTVVGGAGRHTVLQPVVDLRTGRAFAAEGLTRFTALSPAEPPGDHHRSPAQWFDDADRLGLRSKLEVATASSALDLLDSELPDDLTLMVNVGPEVLVGGELAVLLDGRPLERIVVELTEHEPVTDYVELSQALRPYRERGLRIAVDDAGAGYSSLQHVLAVEPDLVKVDMALVRGLDGDLARRTLLTALASFAVTTGCQLVAEGVETEQELAAVAACGIALVQGNYLARPSRRPSWDAYPVEPQSGSGMSASAGSSATPSSGRQSPPR